MGQIPRTQQRLYKVDHAPESAHVAELVSVMELHHCMGHTDVWGSASITRQGRRYFITYLMRTKDVALGAYKSFEAWGITQGHCKGIKVLRSDRGSEYLSNVFNAHLEAAGTPREMTVHDTPQLNGVAERLNRTLLERIRALAHGSSLPKSLWGKSLRHAVWLKNRTATRALDGKTPFEALYGRLPGLSNLRVWGCQVWVHNPDGSKLDVRACGAPWLRLDVDARAYRIHWPGLAKRLLCDSYLR